MRTSHIFVMEEVSDTVGSYDSGRFDNDFEKLPHDEEEVSSTGEPLSGPGSPGGDADTESAATTGDETASTPSMAQLNVDEPSVPKPQPATSDVGSKSDEGAVCTSCESSRM